MKYIFFIRSSFGVRCSVFGMEKKKNVFLLMCPCITWDNIVSFNGSSRHFANLRALTHPVCAWVFIAELPDRYIGACVYV